MGKVAYAALAYAVFLGSMLWAVAFLAGVGAPKTIDSGTPGPVEPALATDLLLVALFGLQHSVMARPAFKRAWTRIVPAPIERSTYVLFASLLLVLLFWQWRPVPALVWAVEPLPARAAIYGLYGVGWTLAAASTFMIDHFDLFGLRQAWAAMKRRVLEGPPFRRVLLYRVVRHPLMTGFLVVFWSTPTMTVGHLVFAAAMSAYIFVGVHYEERDLVAAIGAPYVAYQREVRAVLPVPKRRGSAPPLRTVPEKRT
jgi:protein-S-isoprenylcysteine O-methyltransferase Ste14